MTVSLLAASGRLLQLAGVFDDPEKVALLHDQDNRSRITSPRRKST
jgi:hypothetical protein